mmetsp:Transcript_53970/g.123396  ORF Transcript_53970/g.123396 Transcript_53970/m.123396 type:complete len:236 (+) Transcript_53970:2511-3218(+)
MSQAGVDAVHASPRWNVGQFGLVLDLATSAGEAVKRTALPRPAGVREAPRLAVIAGEGIQRVGYIEPQLLGPDAARFLAEPVREVGGALPRALWAGHAGSRRPVVQVGLVRGSDEGHVHVAARVVQICEVGMAGLSQQHRGQRGRLLQQRPSAIAEAAHEAGRRRLGCRREGDVVHAPEHLRVGRGHLQVAQELLRRLLHRAGQLGLARAHQLLLGEQGGRRPDGANRHCHQNSH